MRGDRAVLVLHLAVACAIATALLPSGAFCASCQVDSALPRDLLWGLALLGEVFHASAVTPAVAPIPVALVYRAAAADHPRIAHLRAALGPSRTSR